MNECVIWAAIVVIVSVCFTYLFVHDSIISESAAMGQTMIGKTVLERKVKK